MKVGSLFVLALLLPAILPSSAHAEIYKWKDKDGSIRYSDVPPPSNIKNEAIGKKIPKASVAPVVNGSPPVVDKEGAATSKEPAPLSKEEAAAKRAQEAEAQKKADEAKQAELKFRQESCAAAKRDLAMYKNGGRLVSTDENGERKYLSEEDLAAGKAQAQQGVDKYCDR